MYGDPVFGLYGHKPNPTSKRKPGRPSAKSKFLEKQGDLFLAEKYLAFVAGAFTAAPGGDPERGTSEDAPPAAASR